MELTLEQLTLKERRILERLIEPFSPEETQFIPALEQKFGGHIIPILDAYLDARPYMSSPAEIIQYLAKAELSRFPRGCVFENIENGFFELKRTCEHNRGLVANGTFSIEELPPEALSITPESFMQVMCNQRAFKGRGVKPSDWLPSGVAEVYRIKYSKHPPRHEW